MRRVECYRWRKMAVLHQDKLPGRQTRRHSVPLTFQNIAIVKNEALEVLARQWRPDPLPPRTGRLQSITLVVVILDVSTS